MNDFLLLMDQKGMQDKDLALAAGTNPSAISNLRGGRKLLLLDKFDRMLQEMGYELIFRRKI